MGRIEIKNWAKEKIKGSIKWEILLATIITTILCQLEIGGGLKETAEGYRWTTGIPIGMLFAFVGVGFALFMYNVINDKEHNIKDLFHFANTTDFARCFVVKLLQTIFIFLWALLLIVPGIIKALAYSLAELILSDEKYKDLSYMDVLKKSEEMMNGHKMDFLVLWLSFLGWHILGIITLGVVEILFIIPYQATATYKFLIDVKENYEKENK